MEKCGYRSVIACSTRGYFCSIDVNLTMRIARPPPIENRVGDIRREIAGPGDTRVRSFALALTMSKPSMASGTVCLASNTSWRWKVRERAG